MAFAPIFDIFEPYINHCPPSVDDDPVSRVEGDDIADVLSLEGIEADSVSQYALFLDSLDDEPTTTRSTTQDCPQSQPAVSNEDIGPAYYAGLWNDIYPISGDVMPPSLEEESHQPDNQYLPPATVDPRLLSSLPLSYPEGVSLDSPLTDLSTPPSSPNPSPLLSNIVLTTTAIKTGISDYLSQSVNPIPDSQLTPKRPRRVEAVYESFPLHAFPQHDDDAYDSSIRAYIGSGSGILTGDVLPFALP